jgi:indole-3-glycerol phosphate synthase
MTAAAPSDLLEAIVAATRRAVEVRMEREPANSVVRRAAPRVPRGDLFRARLSDPRQINIIGECKRRSPSRGVLRHDYDPATIAAGYERAGAVAISVLTEPAFFDGSLADLEAVRAAVDCPVLRKDFVVDEYQLLEARASGADAVLLIVSALDHDELAQLHRSAAAMGLAPLVEVHDVEELDRAIEAGAEIIGVNNRNLRTLEIDLQASEEIARRMPANAVGISESGLRTRDDLARMAALGYRAFLIGESFMTASNPGAALQKLLGARK